MKSCAQLPILLSAAVLFVWAVLAWERAGIWKDEFTLFVRSWQETPHSSRLEHNAIGAILRLPHMQPVFQVTQGPDGSLQFAPRQSANVDWSKVDGTLEEMGRLFPGSAKVSEARGLAWAMRGNSEKALPLFERATREDPSDAVNWNNLGQAFYTINDLAGAEKALAKAQSLSPRNLEVCKTLSAIYWRQEQYAKALEMFNQLSILEPNNPDHRQWVQRAKERLAGNSNSGSKP